MGSQSNIKIPFIIRQALPTEFESIGMLMVSVYSALEGFPTMQEQPEYYKMLSNIGQLAQKPNTQLLVAIGSDKILGAVVYFSDMRQYASGGTALQEKNASGFRLLAVAKEAQGQGIGKALIEHCVALAQKNGHKQVIIHSTKAMQTAWKIYEKRGFKPSPDLDFIQGNLQVFGFRLAV